MPSLAHNVCRESLYKYERLTLHENEIRVLRLLPGTLNEPLRCRLQFRYLASNYGRPRRSYSTDEPQYIALSYTWGKGPKSKCLHIGRKCIPIKENLFAALLHLRSTRHELVLWIDAVCINQKDSIEKNHQVQLMSNIYRGAIEVLVWLGPKRNGISPRKRVARRSKSPHYDSAGDLTDKSEYAESWGDTICVLNEEFWREFLHSPWFERAWVIQEVAHASSVTFRFGRSEFTWPMVCDLARRIQEHDLELYHDIICMNSVDTIILLQKLRLGGVHTARGFHIGSKMRIEEIIHRSRYRLCRDPRDRIYSNLSLAPLKAHGGELLLHPNYDLTVSRIQRDLVFASIEEYKSLNILRYVHHSHEIRLPSWVPRWNSDATEPLVDFSLDYRVQPTKALTMINEYIHPADGTENSDNKRKSNLLLLNGLLLYDLQYVGKSLIDTKDEVTSYSDLRTDTVTKLTPVPYPDYLDFFRAEIRRDLPDRVHFRALYQNKIKQDIHPLIRAKGRKIAISSKGEYILVPAIAEKGDIVVAISGIWLPLVLRPYVKTRITHKTWYLMIGTCDTERVVDWPDIERRGQAGRLEEFWLC